MVIFFLSRSSHCMYINCTSKFKLLPKLLYCLISFYTTPNKHFWRSLDIPRNNFDVVVHINLPPRSCPCFSCALVAKEAQKFSANLCPTRPNIFQKFKYRLKIRPSSNCMQFRNAERGTRSMLELPRLEYGCPLGKLNAVKTPMLILCKQVISTPRTLLSGDHCM